MSIEALSDVTFAVEQLRVRYDRGSGDMVPLSVAELSEVQVKGRTQGEEFVGLYGVNLKLAFPLSEAARKDVLEGSVTLTDLKGRSKTWDPVVVFYRYALGSPILIQAAMGETSVSGVCRTKNGGVTKVTGDIKNAIVFHSGLIAPGFPFGKLVDIPPDDTQGWAPPT